MDEGVKSELPDAKIRCALLEREYGFSLLASEKTNRRVVFDTLALRPKVTA
jgi:hypothetical protein